MPSASNTTTVTKEREIFAEEILKKESSIESSVKESWIKTFVESERILDLETHLGSVLSVGPDRKKKSIEMFGTYQENHTIFLSIDWTGSDPLCPGGLNSSLVNAPLVHLRNKAASAIEARGSKRGSGCSLADCLKSHTKQAREKNAYLCIFDSINHRECQ